MCLVIHLVRVHCHSSAIYFYCIDQTHINNLNYSQKHMDQYWPYLHHFQWSLSLNIMKSKKRSSNKASLSTDRWHLLFRRLFWCKTNISTAANCAIQHEWRCLICYRWIMASSTTIFVAYITRFWNGSQCNGTQNQFDYSYNARLSR
jgi:hypothetical protein